MEYYPTVSGITVTLSYSRATLSVAYFSEFFFATNSASNSKIEIKGHSQLCDCADLDASISQFEKLKV